MLFPFETSIPTEFIIIPPEILIWHSAFYSMLIQSPECYTNASAEQRSNLRKSNAANEKGG